jgi:GntR family transcriptional regulator
VDPITARLADRLAAGVDQPISRLIVDDVWLAVVDGTLSSGDRLPTARQIAIQLGVSPRTVELAYEELETRGVVATRPGEGTFISLRPPPEAERERHGRFAELCRDTFDRAAELGFGVDDLIAALTEFRSVERANSQRRPSDAPHGSGPDGA